ncbi:MAG: Hsp20/alpha crystallin family protein [Desulfomonile tiedjei]|nr:Hsp20/alpha crystallin family protein [Desulfomonile tiedjei]
MTLNRWDPFRDMLSFQERVSHVMDAFAKRRQLARSACWCPVVDILETPESYIFRAELPGVGKDNINVEVVGTRITISGERPTEKDPPIAAYHAIERVHGVFQRSFNLPGPVDVEKAKAKYRDGILEVSLPKSEEESERSISVVHLG